MLALLLGLVSAAPAQLEVDATRHVLREYERIGRSAPDRDPALTAAARAVARVALARGAELASDPVTLSEAISDAGAWEPHPRWIVIRARPADEVLRSLLDRSDLNEDPASHYGLAVESEGGKGALVVVFTDRRAQLRPFPRAFAALPARARLCGALKKDLRVPELFVTAPSGNVDKLPMARVAGQDFCATLRFVAPGRHVVEILARGGRGPEVAALFLVDAGAQAPRGVHVQAEEAQTPDEAREGILTRVNALRRAHGARAVSQSAALSRIAQAYSERMSRENFFAHVAPDGSDVKQRLREGGYAYRLAGENLGLAAGPLSAHFGIEHSPGHRKNLLDPAYTEIGIGVAFQLRSGRRQAVVTEILALPHVESKDPIGDAYRQLDLRRQALKVPPLRRSEALERIAQDHARRALALDQPEAKLPGSEVHEQVFGALGDVTRASVDLYVADDPAQLPSSRNLDDRQNELVGIGAVRGDSPRYGRNKYWVVVIYAEGT